MDFAAVLASTRAFLEERLIAVAGADREAIREQFARTGWRSAIVTSSESSDNPLILDRIAEDIPTTPEDVAALRRARERAMAGFTLEQVHLLEPPEWFPRPPRRRTFEGYEPFEL